MSYFPSKSIILWQNPYNVHGLCSFLLTLSKTDAVQCFFWQGIHKRTKERECYTESKSQLWNTIHPAHNWQFSSQRKNLQKRRKGSWSCERNISWSLSLWKCQSWSNSALEKKLRQIHFWCHATKTFSFFLIFFLLLLNFLPFSYKIGERCVEVWASTSSLESQHLMEHICHEIARIRLRTICCNQMKICTFYGNFKNIKVSFCVGWLTFIIFRLTLQWLRESIVHPNKLHWHSLNDSTAIILHCRFIAIFNVSEVIV